MTGDRQRDEGHHDHRAHARARERHRDRPALVLLEPRRDRRAEADHRHRGVAEPHAGERGVQLPGGGDMPHRGHAERKQHGAARDHRTRAATIDGRTHRREDQRGRQVEDGDARGDERDRPAARLGDLVEIDTRAEHAEAPREHGAEEAERDHAPSVTHQDACRTSALILEAALEIVSRSIRSRPASSRGRRRRPRRSAHRRRPRGRGTRRRPGRRRPRGARASLRVVLDARRAVERRHAAVLVHERAVRVCAAVKQLARERRGVEA